MHIDTQFSLLLFVVLYRLAAVMKHQLAQTATVLNLHALTVHHRANVQSCLKFRKMEASVALLFLTSCFECKSQMALFKPT